MITNLFNNKKHSFQFGIWLLFAVILMLGQQAKAADNYLNAHRAKLTDHIATDGYIQLDLPVYESDGDDEAIYIYSICNRLLLNILQVISQKYGLNL